MRRAISLGFLAAVLAAGCGGDKPKLVPVAGKVVHGGKAVTGGSVWFHPADGNPYAGEKPSGQLQLDGSFAARTYPHGDGMPPGKYKVTLSPDLAGRAGKTNLGDATKTPWEIDVPDGGVKDHLFEVK